MKRRQNIEFDECSCGGQLYCINDCDDGQFYDCERVFCNVCGDVGYMVADERSIVVLDSDEI